jgi:DNA-binding NtrC family response regulator
MNKKQTVLLIDDEPEILAVLQHMLNRAGFEIELAENGFAALEKLEQQNFDIVVCDYLMPKMNGIELLKKVRANKDFTPFIFFSGNADTTHDVEMMGLGAFELLAKTNIKEIVKIVQKTIKQSETLKNIDAALDVSLDEEKDDFLKILHSTGS